MKLFFKRIVLVATVASAALTTNQRVHADIAEPPADCIKSIEHLKACLKRGTITQEQYDVFYPSVAEMANYQEKMPYRRSIAEMHDAFLEAVKFTKRQRWPVSPARCEKDLLDEDAAKGRVLWTIKHLGPRLVGNAKQLLVEMLEQKTYPSLAIYSEDENRVPRWTYPAETRAPTDKNASYTSFENWVVAATCVPDGVPAQVSNPDRDTERLRPLEPLK